MSFDFLKEVMSLNEYSSIAKDGIVAGDFTGFMDSGSYTFNAVLSGTIYGGYAQNKITELAGPSGVGKTFFALTLIKLFLYLNKEGGVFLFESESALSKAQLIEFGIDVTRVYVFPVDTVEKFRHQALSILIKYNEQKKDERKPLLMVLDSLGMLSTEKEMADIGDGKGTKDMTRAGLIKAAFRVLTLKLGIAGVPLILTNHTYQEMCLAEDTKVIMFDDSLKSIKEIKEGDKVKTRSGPKKVLAVYNDVDLKDNDNEMYEIELEDGSLVKCTGNHMFIRKGIWVETKFLKEGDDLQTCD
jgi:RecA/RadA recombinase